MRNSESQSQPIPSEFAISVREDGGSTMIEFSGELDLAHSTEVENAIAKAEKAEGPIVIDLTDLTFRDSVGVAILLMAPGRDRQDGASRLSFIAPRRENVNADARSDRHEHRDSSEPAGCRNATTAGANIGGPIGGGASPRPPDRSGRR
jgi:anti-anti-sigma factor